MQPYSPLTGAALPVDRLERVEVARVQEPAADLDDPARAPLGIQRATSWPPGKNGNSEEQRTSSSGCLAIAAMIRSASRSIPKGFSPSRWRPARGRQVQLLVQVVRDGAVDGLDVRVGEQLAVVRRRAAARARGARTRPARPGPRRTRATSSGRTPRSARCTQRAAALANSRPIRPPPTMPNRTVLMHGRWPSAARHRRRDPRAG